MSADVNVEVVRLGLHDSNGSHRVRLKRGKPKAVMAILTRAVDSDEATHAMMSIGFSDGTNQWASTAYGESGKSTESDTTRHANTTEAADVMGLSAVNRTFSVDSFDDEGVTVTLGASETGSGSNRSLVIVAFSGKDVKAFVGADDVDGVGTGSTKDIDVVGFQPSVVLFSSAYRPPQASVADHARLGFGVGISSAEQGLIALNWEDASSSFNAASLIANDACVGAVSTSINLWRSSLQSMHSNGFVLETVVSSGDANSHFGYLALELGDTPLALVHHDTPTDEEVVKNTDLGSMPQAVILGTSLADDVNTRMTTSPPADHFGVSILAEEQQWSASTAYKDGGSSSSSVASSFLKESALYATDGDSNLKVAADLVGFTDTGFDLNFTEADIVARKYWALSIGDSKSASPPRISVFSWVDATAPGRGLTPIGERVDNSAQFKAILDNYLTDDPSSCGGLYIPPGIYHFASKVQFPIANGWRIQGGGGHAKSLNQLGNNQGCWTLLRWVGGTTGPMFQIGGPTPSTEQVDGWLFDSVNFDGVLGPNKISGANALDVLFQWDQGLFAHFRDCGFFRAEKLLFSPFGTGVTGPAELTFSKCYFNCGEGSSTMWTSYAFFSAQNQTVNNLFHNCEFNNCGWCVGVDNAGRVIMRDTTIVRVAGLLEVENAGQNVDGHLIENVHIDMQGGDATNTKLQYYKSTLADSETYGPVVIRQVKPGTLGGGAAREEFVDISSYSLHFRRSSRERDYVLQESPEFGFV